METIKKFSKETLVYIKPFFIWIALALVMGLLGGVLGAAFHKCLEIVTDVRSHNTWIILLLPLAGVLITAIYKAFRSEGKLNTNRILEAADSGERVPIVLAPLIFVGTIITHLFGGSAGREGAALQLGGSIGYNVGRILKLDKSDLRIIVMAGMSSFFSSMFGAPLTAAIFALEVVRVGYVHHYGFMPCILSSVIAYEISTRLGTAGVRFDVLVPQISSGLVIKIIILGVLCALVSILFCVAIKKTSVWLHRLFHNSYLRTVTGALFVVVLTVLLRTTDYNGAGMEVITRAMDGSAEPLAFLIKIIFTAITIAAGFKGGEIVPTLFIGATFGCMAGGILGLDAGFAASVGFVALFCGVTNCPLASIALALEVFGAKGILLYAIVCAVSFMMSGNFGLYTSQKILSSKIS